MARSFGRGADGLRPLRITPNAAPFAEGSALIEMGNTRVLCAASVETNLPSWLRGQGRGWVTAEYALLPRSTQTRNRRERNGLGGRTQEIQRLIGRSLRMALDLEALGEISIIVDCDVLQADGGTRTASITGGYVALVLAIRNLQAQGLLENDPLRYAIAAVSAGIVDGEALLDLDYEEDKRAEVDCNIVQTHTGAFVELQATGEGAPLERSRLDTLLSLSEAGLRELFAAQQAALEAANTSA
jgi:ribonuclease PH